MVKHYVIHRNKSLFINKNISFSSIDSYNGPQPPTGTGPHRYLLLLYQSIDKIADKKYGREQRLCFPLQQYITDNRLGLLDATYFTVEG